MWEVGGLLLIDCAALAVAEEGAPKLVGHGSYQMEWDKC